MRVLLDVLSVVLVEQRQVSRTRGAASGVPMDHRLARRVHRGAVGQRQRRVQVVPMSHDHELQQGVPERLESSA